jgi:hypothetical protein
MLLILKVTNLATVPGLCVGHAVYEFDAAQHESERTHVRERDVVKRRDWLRVCGSARHEFGDVGIPAECLGLFLRDHQITADWLGRFDFSLWPRFASGAARRYEKQHYRLSGQS